MICKPGRFRAVCFREDEQKCWRFGINTCSHPVPLISSASHHYSAVHAIHHSTVNKVPEASRQRNANKMLSTRTIELEPIQLPAPTITKQQQPSSRLSLSRNVDAPVDQCQTPNSESNFVTQPSQRWNESPSTILRLFSTFFTFFVMGANDAAYGPLLPSVSCQKYCWSVTFADLRCSLARKTLST